MAKHKSYKNIIFDLDNNKDETMMNNNITELSQVNIHSSSD